MVPKEQLILVGSETKVGTLWWLLSRSLISELLITYFLWEMLKDNLLIAEIGVQVILLDGPMQINYWCHSASMSPFNQFILKVSSSHQSTQSSRAQAVWNTLLLATRERTTSEEGTMPNGLTPPVAQQQVHSVQTSEDGFQTPKTHKILPAPLDSQPNSPCTFHKQWATFTSHWTPTHITWFHRCAEQELTKTDYYPHKPQITLSCIWESINPRKSLRQPITPLTSFLILGTSIIKQNTTSLWSSQKVIQLTKQEQQLLLWWILIILILIIQIRRRASRLVLILEGRWPSSTNSVEPFNNTWTAKLQVGSWTHLK